MLQISMGHPYTKNGSTVDVSFELNWASCICICRLRRPHMCRTRSCRSVRGVITIFWAIASWAKTDRRV